MAFEYDPTSVEETGTRAKEGIYPWKVDDAEEAVSKAGNDMIKLTMLVGALPNRDITVYEYLVNTPKALFKTQNFCESCGIDFFKGRLAAGECINKTGKAAFKPNEDGYLRVAKFLPAKANNTGEAPPVPTDDDNVPF